MVYHVYAHRMQFLPLQEIFDLIDLVLADTENDNDICYIINLSWESFAFYSWIDRFRQALQRLKSARPNCKIFVVANDNFVPYKQNLHLDMVDDVLIVDFFLYRTCHELFQYRVSLINRDWNYTANKFLCLGGRVKPVRAHLLSRMADEGLLDRALYSLNADGKNLEPKISKIIENSTINDYETSCCGVYYSRPFEQVLFQVVVENSCGDNETIERPYLTEKTWLCMVNHMPFLMYGDPETFSVLKRKGFRTFENYVPIQNYDELDYQCKTEALIQNIDFWLGNIDHYREDIQKDILHNYENLLRLYDQYQQDIDKFMLSNRIDAPTYKVVPTDYFHVDNNWSLFYNNVKSSWWPKNVNFRDATMLPSQIKTELLTHDYSFLNEWPVRMEEFKKAMTNHTTTI